MDHPMYENGYALMEFIIDIGLSLWWLIGPFLLLSVIIGVLNFLQGATGGGDGGLDYDRDNSD
jgi:hypothetical protein